MSYPRRKQQSRMVFLMHVQDPKETIRLSPPQKKLPMNPSTSPMGTSPFPSLSRGQGCYRLTLLCLPKRLLTLGGRSGQADYSAEARGRGGQRLQTLIQNSYNQACGETLLTKTLLRDRLCS